MAIVNPKLSNARYKPVSSQAIADSQRTMAGGDEAVQFASQLQQLPAYRQYLQTLQAGSTAGERKQAYRDMIAQAESQGINVPKDLKVTPYGSVQEKTWADKHDKLMAVMIIAGFAGGGIAAGAALGGAAAAPAVAGATAGGAGAGGGAGAAGAAGAGGAAAGGAGAVLPSTTAGVPLAAAGPVAGGTSSGAVAAGLGGAGSSSVLGMSPSTWELIYGAGSQGINAYTGSKNTAADREAALQRAQMGVAADENARDPFRQQMSQIRNLGQMDLMQNIKAPAAAGPSGAYARAPGEGVQPQSYAPSPEMLQWIAMMKQNVARGQNTAPTMTNPANYGRTSALNLTAPGAPPASAQAGPSALTLEQMLELSKRGRQPTGRVSGFGAAERV